MTEGTLPELPTVAPEALSKLKDRALTASAEGITIADARLPDRPLIYVNAGFERLTGYSREEAIGRNCRFLQGAGTAADTVTEIRTAIQRGRECTVEILNYRKDGTPFWNRLAITPVKDESGEVTHFIGIQSDVTKRRQAEDALRKAKIELESALGELQKDLDLAARIQQSLLPKASPKLDRLEAAWEFIPCTHLAGDFLNVFALDDRHAAFYVLDVSGHGASAALLSVTLSRWLSAVPEESCLYRLEESSETGFRIARPPEVAAHLNERFRSAPDIAQYFTMVYGVIDVRARQLTYTAAGHPGPILVPAKGEPAMYSSTGLPIGMLPDVEFREKTLTLVPGDRVFLFTDGVTEALNVDSEEFGKARLLETLARGREVTLRRTLKNVVSQVREWQGDQGGFDDLSLLGAQIS
jgi:sigma-B regulation protein RsbU (phosphoserine phosphatase)